MATFRQRVEPQASAAKRGARANAIGRSRGGFTRKVHARSDNEGRPFGVILTGGEASDDAAADALMVIPVTPPKALLADKGHDGDAFRQNRLIHGILPIIPPRSNMLAGMNRRSMANSALSLPTVAGTAFMQGSSAWSP